MVHRLACLGVVLLLVVSSTAQAQQWGTLKGQFVYDGKAPEPQPLTITKDQQFCGKFDLTTEEVRVNPENGGLANVVVYLYLSRGDKEPQIHPDYQAQAEKEVVLDNEQCRFDPHVQTLWTKQTLVVKNSDSVGHNTKIDTIRNTPINPIIPANGTMTHQFEDAERLPVLVSCSIHPWMTARLVVKDNPYMAVTDENGNFEIANLPAGDWTFQIWHEAAGYVTGAKQNGKKVNWRRGRMEQTIKAGENDLGKLLVDPKLFDK